MGVQERLLGGRLSRASSSDVMFEGPFADDKRVAMASDSVVARLAALHQILGGYVTEGPLRVGVLSNHRVETYVSVLAASSFGATFVPLNPKFPVERLRTIIELSTPHVIFGDRSTLDVHASVAPQVPFIDVAQVDPAPQLVEGWARHLADSSVDVGSVAYVMFTSGSTGTPKGVPVSYGNLCSYVDGISQLIDFPNETRWTQFFDLSFDLSIHDIFVSHRCGGTLVAPTQIDLMMPGAYVARERIDVWFSVPVLGAQLGNGKPKEGFAGMAQMLFCGEALPVETVDACRPWLSSTGRMWNLYGPTEATIAFTAADVTESSRTAGNASIGTAFGVNHTALRGEAGEITHEPTIGSEGELLLGGPQVFAGYSTDAPSPFVESNGERFYRSGDLVRVDDEGIYFRGRVDSQVKFRGYRIELGEIESAARRVFNLKTVAVVVFGSHTDAKLAMFYLAGEAGEVAFDPRTLESILPKYMIPSKFIQLDTMPTNQNGKIDRRRLVADHGGDR